MKEYVSFKRQSGFSDIIIYVLVFVCAMFLVQTVDMFMFSPVTVEGASMEPLLKNGDVLLINKMKKAEFLDVIVVKIDEETQYIKRLIGFGGDKIWTDKEHNIHREYTDSHGARCEIIISFESYVSEENKNKTFISETTVKEGYIFFLGDNREISRDSREIGMLPEENIVGVVTDFWLKHKLKFLF